MADSTTVLYNPTNPSEDAKRFTFDFSYWSHDGFKENNKPTNGGGSATGAGATANHQQASSTVYIGDASHQNGHQYADQVKFVCLCQSVFFVIIILHQSQPEA